MVLGKITIEISVRYIPKSEQSKEKDISPKTMKPSSLPRKQNKNISQNSKKIIKGYIAGERFPTLTK